MSDDIDLHRIRKQAAAFVKRFSHIKSEKRYDQDFMREFCALFGIRPRRIEWQYPVKEGKVIRYIDGLIVGSLLIEMKSAGKNLEQAYQQAVGYLGLIKESHQPDYILVSDFNVLHLYNRVTGEPRIEIKLVDLPQQIEPFLFLTGYEKLAIEKQERINKEAAEKMADLHDAIKASGYFGKDLERYLVRLLFCLFADNTGLFGENGTFLNYLHNHTKIDGSDLHGALAGLFHTLNTAPDKRQPVLPEYRAKLPYINGELFEGCLEYCEFDETTRATLMECAKLDWSEISPAIFGSLFQAIMHFADEAATAKTKKRREFGAHYTSEENILKTINPLFMDDLQLEFDKIRRDKRKLALFQQKLARLNFFDPACGCGNFLIIAYRELRLLELEVIKAQWGDVEVAQLDVETLILCNVHQFHGIDIDESAVQIATLAMWLTDHQMNLRVQELGLYYKRIPLKKKANIVRANALQIAWESVIEPEQCNFIMGNPPFVGYKYQTAAQKMDLALVFKGMSGAGVLDYVAAWHIKAARYIQANPTIPVAFVSTNSLTQGEQVAILWTTLLRLNIKLYFAHRTFRWRNEGRGVAAVHCVIMGFGLQEPSSYRLYDYGDDIKGKPVKIQASQINPYLVDAPTILIKKRRQPLTKGTSEIVYGNAPRDGGHLVLSEAEANAIRQNDPIAAQYLRLFLGSDEFINNLPRYCLWLTHSTASDRLKSPEIKKRMERVSAMRLTSLRGATQKFAETPYLFEEIRHTDKPYLLIPIVSSETRRFIPIGYLPADVVCSNASFMLPNASLYDFGMLCSSFHNAWMRAVCGRLKSDYRYSNTIVYNNFPFPENVKPAQLAKIETAAQQILAARKTEEQRCAKQGQPCSLASLYAAGNMPTELLKAHTALDKAVDAAYGYKGGKEDTTRVAFLFALYQKLTMSLIN